MQELDEAYVDGRWASNRQYVRIDRTVFQSVHSINHVGHILMTSTHLSQQRCAWDTFTRVWSHCECMQVHASDSEVWSSGPSHCVFRARRSQIRRHGRISRRAPVWNTPFLLVQPPLHESGFLFFVFVSHCPCWPEPSPGSGCPCRRPSCDVEKNRGD